MWVLVALFASLCVPATLACHGCHFDQDALSVSHCSESSKDIIEFDIQSLQLTQDCIVKTKGKKNFLFDVEAAELRITGHAGEREINYKNDNFCQSLEKKDFDGHSVDEILQAYQLPTSCKHQPPSEEYEDSERKVKDEFQNKIAHVAGKTEIKIEFLKVNGDESKNACLLVKSHIKCDQQKRKPKSS